MKKILKKLNINIILSLCLSYFTIYTLTKLYYISNYNIITFLLFFVFFYIYKETNIIKQINKKNAMLTIYSSIVSLILIIGYYTYTNMYNTEINIIKEILNIKNLLYFIGFFPMIYSLILKLTGYINNIKKDNYKTNSKKIFFIAFVVMFITWFIYYLSFYPGILTPDSIDQMNQIINNLNGLSNHHPVLHTLFMLVPFKIGSFIFGSTNAGVACISFVQLILLASVFAYIITYLYMEKCNKYILLIILLFYSLSSIFGFYSITLWKDVLFGTIILLFTLVLYNIVKNEKQLKKKNYIELFLISLLCMFIRNNGLYIMFLIVPILYFSLKNKKIIVVTILSIVIYLIISGPIFDALKITKSSSKEYIAIPLQQIGRMAYKNVSFTKEEKEYLKTIMSVEKLKENYNPMTVDGIKFNKNFKIEGFDKNKLKFINIWSNLVIKHSSIAIESYLISTLGYWYPNVSFWSVGYGIYENDLNIKSDSLLPDNVKEYLIEQESRDNTLFGIQWSIGGCLLMILYLVAYNIYSKRYKLLICFLPVFGVWATLMIATPVFAEFRYIFSAFTTLPLLFGISTLNYKK